MLRRACFDLLKTRARAAFVSSPEIIVGGGRIQSSAFALRNWLENEVGEERASLMTILGTHKVKVPGGGEEAKAFMDDLLLWKAKGQLLAKEEEEKKKSFEEEFGLPFDE